MSYKDFTPFTPPSPRLHDIRSSCAFFLFCPLAVHLISVVSHIQLSRLEERPLAHLRFDYPVLDRSMHSRGFTGREKIPALAWLGELVELAHAAKRSQTAGSRNLVGPSFLTSLHANCSFR